ncbi:MULTISPECIES: nuclear transport factor 2 family protein [Paraburkholderia]|uniref:nuclear transport factor 2 family protein n=1 Tax=Paraburkholderia TaxID=1822464 RepID=UPI0022547CFA|nr:MULTISPECIES: nuclear transport factor 2 family protein [Paraburkholderia]MCX4163610.1 nuclear transport factor 2 family protein [Paraburkholderia megapolitana]MDN7159105.1 nuclear transport factor 2 family protein [Paraburkholderia sp. CHISQ3]MDQ6496152.1 nuclear transport factor 2 family protein [Paraburkholderia megapolitana]
MQHDRQDEQAALKTIQDFLDGIQARDKEAMLRLVLPDGGATLLRNGQPLHMSMRAVIERIEFDAAIEMIESIHDPLVLIDSDIAMAWTPYEFHMNGALHHLGTNIFTLLRRNGRWLISGVADYSRAPNDVPQ